MSREKRGVAVLVLALSISLVYLAIVNSLSSHRAQTAIAVVVGGLAATLLPVVFISISLSVIAAQFALMIAILLIWLPIAGRRKFLAFSLAATALAYGIGVRNYFDDLAELTSLKNKFAYVSLEDRLPTAHVRIASERLPRATEQFLTELEAALDNSSEAWQLDSRADQIRKLHKRNVRAFVNSQGFGVGRIVRQSARSIDSSLREDGDIAQPATADYSFGSSEMFKWAPGASAAPPLDNLHQAAIVDFSYIVGFGDVKDRRQVAGFQSHRFNGVPEADIWEIRRLDLVGAVVHENPVVYLSENLPRMDEARKAPTRSLDPSEAIAWAKLMAGEDIVFAEREGTIRALGAIRSAKQCVQCHGGERGDLLGAFSYTLRRK
jgi:hypothetical protein